jgi:putative transposase
VLSEHGCKIAPNTYWVARKRPPPARAVRDGYLRGEIARVHAENLSVYGADKVWAQLNREGIRVARCTVERLMRQMGLSGARRGRAFKVTTRSDERQRRPDDLVDRHFKAPAPNRLWVADLTYVRTFEGWVYAAFVIDVFSRMVVGWQISKSLRSDLAIDALEMAIWNRTRAGQVIDGLVHHSDRVGQGGLNGSSQHLDRGGVRGNDAGTAASRPVVSGAGAVAWAADGGLAKGSGPVLGGDRSGGEDRGRGCGRGRVIAGGVPVVPPRWRREPLSGPERVGPLSLIRRA